MSVGISFAVENLSVDYPGPSGPSRVLDAVSLVIAPASVAGLVGQSGSGKSTMGLACLGLLAANARVVSGHMRFGERTLDMADRRVMASLRGGVVSMIFQDPLAALNPVFTIGSHLAEVLSRCVPGLNSNRRKARAIEALATVGFLNPDRAFSQYPHQLSGGMRQRVVIAMALLAEAKLVIADEPTTALDAEVENQVMAELMALRSRIGCSILLISHSLGLVSRLCDTVHVMLAGSVVESGPAGRVMAEPAHAYTRELLACEVTLQTPRPNDSRAFRFPVIDAPDCTR